MRMKTVVQWYLSGFYKKPKGLKKPYNPIIGETFRCYWVHPNGTKSKSCSKLKKKLIKRKKLIIFTLKKTAIF